MKMKGSKTVTTPEIVSETPLEPTPCAGSSPDVQRMLALPDYMAERLTDEQFENLQARWDAFLRRCDEHKVALLAYQQADAAYQQAQATMKQAQYALQAKSNDAHKAQMDFLQSLEAL